MLIAVPALSGYSSDENFHSPQKILLSACNDASAMSEYTKEHNLASLFTSSSTATVPYLRIQGNTPFSPLTT